MICTFLILNSTIAAYISSRLLQRGAFPLKPTQNGLIFVPLNYELPISSQIENIDGVLHKATDEIIAAEMSSSSDFANRVVYTKGMQELQR